MLTHWPFFFTAARLILGLVGLLLLYMGFFMYEDERGRLQNRLVDLWVKVSLKQEGSLRKEAAVLSYVSLLASTLLDEVLGTRLVSLWAVVVSTYLSLASAYFLNANEAPPSFATVFLFLGALLAIQGLIASYSFKDKQPVWPCFLLSLNLILFILLFDLTYLFPLNARDVLRVEIPTVFIGLFSAVCCFFAVIVFTRWLLRRMAAPRNTVELFAEMFITMVLSYLLADLLSLGTLSGLVFVDPLCKLILKHSDVAVLSRISFAASTNLFPFLVASSGLLLTATSLIHRSLWPMVGRSVNALYEADLLRSRKVQISAGLALTTLIFPSVAKVLKALLST